MHTVDPANGTKPFKGITKVSLRIHEKDKNINKKYIILNKNGVLLK